jgi:hypothetical protein
MDIGTIAAAITSSVGASLSGAYWLARTLIQHRLQAEMEARRAGLAQQLETHKLGLNQQLERMRGDLQAKLAQDKAQVEGSIRREVETFLGQAAAQRQYEFDARKRLYLAIGPLRFQLLLACRDLAGRVQSLGSSERHYSLSLTGYFGRSTLYRLLRVLAIAEVIETQVALNDFSVDPGAIDCLRFRRSLTRILSGDELVHGHPDVDWTRQAQHVYSDRLTVCAQALVDGDGGKAHRILRFQEFNARLDEAGVRSVAPFDTLLNDFQPTSKPLLWLRLIACGHACNALVDRLGAECGFVQREFPTERLLAEGKDAVIAGDAAGFAHRIADIALVSL